MEITYDNADTNNGFDWENCKTSNSIICSYNKYFKVIKSRRLMRIQ